MRATKTYLKDITYEVIGAAIEVHKTLGPGLLESIYHMAIKRELEIRDIKYVSEIIAPIEYKGINIEANLRCDLLVEDILAIELKSLDRLLPIHEAQLLTYMKLLNCPKGILINFNVINLYKEGQKTFVNELFRTLPE